MVTIPRTTTGEEPARRLLPLILALIILITPCIWADPPERLFSGQEYTQFIETLYNASPVEQLEEAFQILSAAMRSHQDDLSDLTIARAAMLLGKHFTVESYCEDSDRAKELLFFALDLAKTIEDPTLQAEALAVQAEASGSLFLIDQFAYLFTYGLKSSNLTNNAWKEDPGSIRVRILRANQLLYTPGLYGGSLKRSEEVFQQLLEDLSPLAPEDLFSIYQGLGIIRTRQRRPEEAREYLQLAQALFPGNRYIPELLEELPQP